MVSKTYKPLSAVSSQNVISQQNSAATAADDTAGTNASTGIDIESEYIIVPKDLSFSSVDSAQDDVNSQPDVATKESGVSDHSSSREELELYNSNSLVLEPELSRGELELSNSQSMVLDLSNLQKGAGSTEGAAETREAVVAEAGEAVVIEPILPSSML